jgi:hypothetical protein
MWQAAGALVGRRRAAAAWRRDELAPITTADGVEQLLRAIYGDVDRPKPAAARGRAVHIAAVWEREDGELVPTPSRRILPTQRQEVSVCSALLPPADLVLGALSPEQVVIDVGSASAPRSPHDAFVLSAARASAGVIATTGANLRAEPLMTHEPFGVAAAGLRAWRTAQRGGKAGAPPCSVVLSRDPALDLSHRLCSLTEDTGATILTDSRSAALALRRQCQTEDRRAHVVELRGTAFACFSRL